MRYQRLHIRVPASGQVTLSAGTVVRIEATAINICAGGICIATPEESLDLDEYQISVTTDLGIVRFTGAPVYQSDAGAGFSIVSIEDTDLDIIYRLVEEFQLTEDFIKHIDEHDILSDWLVDESGSDIDITFEMEPENDDG